MCSQWRYFWNILRILTFVFIYHRCQLLFLDFGDKFHFISFIRFSAMAAAGSLQKENFPLKRNYEALLKMLSAFCKRANITHFFRRIKPSYLDRFKYLALWAGDKLPRKNLNNICLVQAFSIIILYQSKDLKERLWQRLGKKILAFRNCKFSGYKRR